MQLITQLASFVTAQLSLPLETGYWIILNKAESSTFDRLTRPIRNTHNTDLRLPPFLASLLS